MIDYTAHESLYSHLQTSYNSAPFDAILDCRGSEALYRNCPGYLKSGGKFFTIESGLLSTVKFMMHPTMLGGTPRKFVSCMNSPSGESAKVAATWVEKGWIKEIPIDSTYDMDNAVKVSLIFCFPVGFPPCFPSSMASNKADKLKAYEKLASKHAAGKIIVKVAKQ